MNEKDTVPGSRSTWYTPLGTTMMVSATRSLRVRGHHSTELPGKWPPVLIAMNSASASPSPEVVVEDVNRGSLAPCQKTCSSPRLITHSASSAERYTLHPNASAQCRHVE